MRIGIPRESKAHEYRVAILPVGVEMLVQAGHEVLLQRSAGEGSGYPDAAYERAGAILTDDAEAIFERCELIVKVKEPAGEELNWLRRGQVIFTFFHFAANPALTQACLDSGMTGLAYETLEEEDGRLPLLTPMSEIAGRMSIQEGAKYLEKPTEGRGILLSGVPGVEPANVLVLGAGVVGTNAARVAAGLGARVELMDVDLDRLRYLDEILPPNVRTIYSDPHAVAEHAVRADLVVGAVLIPGGRTPVLVRRELLRRMRGGAVIVDVGVDQGGCVETTRPTTHESPIFIEEGVVHYGVTNMPGAVGRTSTQALCHATQPYVLHLAEHGADRLTNEDPRFATALNVRDGKIVNEAVREAIEAQAAACSPDLKLTS